RSTASAAVYLAATLAYRADIEAVRDRLPPTCVSSARWLDLDPMTRPSCQFDAGLALNRLAAWLCMVDIRASDVLLAVPFEHRSHGLSVEVGIALAGGCRVIYVGETRCSFDMLDFVTLAANVDTALAILGCWYADESPQGPHVRHE